MALAKATPAPNFTLPLLKGNEFSLSRQLGQAPLLLFFFKTTCPVCQLASPYVERLSQSGARVYGVGQNLDHKTIKQYTDEYSLTFPVALEQPGYEVSNKYDIDVVPTLFLVSADSMVEQAVECFDKAGYETVAATLGVPSPFRVSDNVPAYRPG